LISLPAKSENGGPSAELPKYECGFAYERGMTRPVPLCASWQAQARLPQPWRVGALTRSATCPFVLLDGLYWPKATQRERRILRFARFAGATSHLRGRRRRDQQQVRRTSFETVKGAHRNDLRSSCAPGHQTSWETLEPSRTCVRQSVPNCMWWFENGRCNSSDAAGRVSLW
jgi:hypothetical protein